MRPPYLFCLTVLFPIYASASFVPPFEKTSSDWRAAFTVRVSDSRESAYDAAWIFNPQSSLEVNLLDAGVGGAIHPVMALSGTLRSTLEPLALAGSGVISTRSIAFEMDAASISFVSPLAFLRLDGSENNFDSALFDLSASGTWFLDGTPFTFSAASQGYSQILSPAGGGGFFVYHPQPHVLDLGSTTIDGLRYAAAIELGWILAVPEPSSALLVALGLLFLSNRRIK